MVIKWRCQESVIYNLLLAFFAAYWANRSSFILAASSSSWNKDVSVFAPNTALRHYRPPTSSSEPNRSMSSSSSSFAGGLEAEVVSATPGGPYWPRGFLTPGRLMQPVCQTISHDSGDGVRKIHFPHLLFWKDFMWLYQRRACIRSADGGDEMASNTTTSAWDGTYLKPGNATGPK